MAYRRLSQAVLNVGQEDDGETAEDDVSVHTPEPPAARRPTWLGQTPESMIDALNQRSARRASGMAGRTASLVCMTQ